MGQVIKVSKADAAESFKFARTFGTEREQLPPHWPAGSIVEAEKRTQSNGPHIIMRVPGQGGVRVLAAHTFVKVLEGQLQESGDEYTVPEGAVLVVGAPTKLAVKKAEA